jgi:hypothetical protein
MRKIILSILLVVAVVTCGLVVYASVGVNDGNSKPIGTATDIGNNNVLTYTFNGSTYTITGVNWVAVHALDTSYGGHSGVNWTSLGG